jgi:hypothetical protein
MIALVYGNEELFPPGYMQGVKLRRAQHGRVVFPVFGGTVLEHNDETDMGLSGRLFFVAPPFDVLHLCDGDSVVETDDGLAFFVEADEKPLFAVKLDELARLRHSVFLPNPAWHAELAVRLLGGDKFALALQASAQFGFENFDIYTVHLSAPFVVRAVRFELTTPCFQNKYATAALRPA